MSMESIKIYRNRILPMLHIPNRQNPSGHNGIIRNFQFRKFPLREKVTGKFHRNRQLLSNKHEECLANLFAFACFGEK